MDDKMDSKEINALKKKAVNLDPVLRIGKNGLNESVLSEINKMLNKRGLIKIKALKSFAMSFDLDETIDKIVKFTNSQLISKKGFVIVLYKKKKISVGDEKKKADVSTPGRIIASRKYKHRHDPKEGTRSAHSRNEDVPGSAYPGKKYAFPHSTKDGINRRSGRSFSSKDKGARRDKNSRRTDSKARNPKISGKNKYHY